MKKTLFTLSVCIFGLTACSEHDKAYYLANIKQAETKKSECEAEIKQAISAKDETKFEKVKNNFECQAAAEAIREHRIAEQEKARIEKEKAEQEAINQAKNSLQAQLGKLDWKAVANHYVNNECATKWIISKDYQCRALKQIYEENAEKGKTELLKQPLAELLANQKHFCGRDKRKYSVCDIWQKAVTEQAKQTFSQVEFPELSKQQNNYCEYNSPNYPACDGWRTVFDQKQNEVINNYTKNYDQLKQDYNQCVMQLQKIGDNYRKYKERNAVTQNYPCREAQEARVKLGLGYDNFTQLLE